MKVTLNWLKEMLKTDRLDADEIADLLTMSGTEVKKVDRPGERFSHITVGIVEDFGPHPNADKLRLCRVNAGDRVASIVCGAANFQKGDRVALALPGARLGTMTIKRSKIRGQVSEGMMCSEAELGLSQESEGIMVLDPQLQAGQSFARAMGLEDVVFELEVTPNRPDCLSVAGIAREIAAMKGLKLKLDQGSRDLAQDQELDIDIQDFSLCSRYSAKIFEGISQQSSPRWLQSRLKLCDVRPKDLVVDLTNYVMLETGQPLHAFDRDLLASKKIMVRPARQGEQIRTIDDTLIDLQSDMVVIADEKGPVALAGIMGGKDTEINPATSSILLEAANFNGPAIMKASKRLGLRSEASNRFEKKIDPHLTLLAINRFEQLLSEVTGQVSASGLYDSFSKPQRERKLVLRTEKVHQILGEAMEAEQIADILNSLDIASKAGKGQVEAQVPSFRYEDLTREIDLIEEVARIYGFNKFCAKPPTIRQRAGGYSSSQKAVRDIRESLADIGVSEVINYSFISKKNLEQFRLTDQLDSLVQIINPINEDFAYLRPSLLPAMAANAAYNLKYKIADLALFEVSRVFRKAQQGKLAAETNMLGILLTGKKNQKGWNQQERFYDFYDLKGIVEYLCGKYFPDQELFIQQKERPFFHPAISGTARIGKTDLGILGQIHPNLSETLEIGQDMFYAELNLDTFIGGMQKHRQFKPVPVYPSIDMDIAIVIDQQVGNREIEQAIWQAGSKLLKAVSLFDLYQGKQIQEGQKSMAYSLIFQAQDRTLKDREAEMEVERIVQALAKKFNARLRQ